MGHHFEELSSRILGAGVEVHKALGPGFLESIYQRAMEVALDHRGIRFQRQRKSASISREWTWEYSASTWLPRSKSFWN